MTGQGWGTTTVADGPNYACQTGGGIGPGMDIHSTIEIKNLYLEFPIPLVPWPTTIRLGGQPGAGTAQDKNVVYFDDFPGVYFNTTFTPAVKLHLLFAQHDENGPGCVADHTLGTRYIGACGSQANTLAAPTTGAPIRTSFGRGDDFVIGGSLDVTPMPGLDVRPFYLYWLMRANFQNSQNLQLPISGTGGINPAAVYGSNQGGIQLTYSVVILGGSQARSTSTPRSSGCWGRKGCPASGWP